MYGSLRRVCYWLSVVVDRLCQGLGFRGLGFRVLGGGLANQGLGAMRFKQRGVCITRDSTCRGFRQAEYVWVLGFRLWPVGIVGARATVHAFGFRAGER